MATTKKLTTRIQQKHDTEANWLLVPDFTPLPGETIIYDPDEAHAKARFKIGDGTTAIGNLPFLLDENLYHSPKNKLDFYDPSLIDISYSNSTSFPGWQVQISGKQDGDVYDISNKFFSGGAGLTERKEINFKSKLDYVDIAFQPTSAHKNACSISNVRLTRVDGQSTGLYYDMTTNTFGYKKQLATASFESDGEGWTFINNSTSWYGSGRKLIPGTSNNYGLKLSNVQWKKIATRTYTVTPNVEYTIKFRLLVEQDALNFYVYNGANTSAASLITSYGLTGDKTYSHTITPTSSSITLCFSAANEAQAIGYLDEVALSYIEPGVTNWGSIVVNSESRSSLNTTNKTMKLKSPWGGYWGEYIKIPILNVDIDKIYVMRFKASVTSGGFNITGENIEFITRPTSYVAGTGEYAFSFKVSSSTDRYLIFKGSGSGNDDITLQDIYFFSDYHSLSSIDTTRWTIRNNATRAQSYVNIDSSSQGYTNDIQTLAIHVEPATEYKLSFDIEYTKSDTINWKPYITMTDEDKVAWVTDGCVTSETPQCGGPWTGKVTDESHKLKIDLGMANSNNTAGNNYDGTYFNPRVVYFKFSVLQLAKLQVKTEVIIGKQGDEASNFTRSQISYVQDGIGTGHVAILQIPLHDLCACTDDYVIKKITWIFTPTANTGVTATIQSVTDITLFGDVNITDFSSNHRAFTCTPTKDVKFEAAIYAKKLVCALDDGCVD